MEKRNAMLIELNGVPCSGKTTWAMQFILTHINAYRVSRDDLRVMLKGNVYTPRDEPMVSACETRCIDILLKSGFTVVIDTINLYPGDIWKRYADKYSVGYEYKFFPIELGVAINRDAMRIDKPSVGREKIREMHAILQPRK